MRTGRSPRPSGERMGGFGWHNGWPFEWGGDDTDDELVYNALRNAVGTGGAAADDSGLDGLWRQCKAQALATLNSMAERAALQVLPSVATDHLPVYEDILRIVPGEDETELARRAAVVADWTRQLKADGPSLAQQIALIDPRASLEPVPHELATTTVLGKAFEPQDGTPTYGPRRSTSYPNFATEFLHTVVLAVDGGLANASDLVVIGQLKRLMREVLPTWEDFQVVTGVGFILDLSPLDVTAMT